MSDGARAVRAERDTGRAASARAPAARPPVVLPADAGHPLLDLQEAVGNRVATGLVTQGSPLVRIVAYEPGTGAATGYLANGATVPVQVLTNRFAPGSYTVSPAGAPVGDADADFVRWSGGGFEWRQAVATFQLGGSVTVVVEPDPAAAFARLPNHIRAYLLRGVTGRPSGAELAALVEQGEQLVRDGITEADLALADDPTAAVAIEEKLADIDLVEAMRRAGWSDFPSREEFFRRLAADVAQTSDFRRWWGDEATARAWWAAFPEDAARDWDAWGEQVYQKAKRAEEASWLEAFRRFDAAGNVGEAIGWVTVFVAGGFLGSGPVAAGTRFVGTRAAAVGRVLKDVPAAVEAASGVKFGLWMKALTASGLSANFVNSLINRTEEGTAAGSNPLSIVAAALVDAPGVGKLYEAVTDESLLTSEDLNRSDAERWAAGLTGGAETALNMLGIRDLFGGGTPRPTTPRAPAAEPEPVPAAAGRPATPAPAAEPAPAPTNAAPARPSRDTGAPRPVTPGPVRSWFSRHILSAITRGVLEGEPSTRGVPGAGSRPRPALIEAAEVAAPRRAASVADTPDVPSAPPAATPDLPTGTPAAGPRAPAAAPEAAPTAGPAATPTPRAPGVLDRLFDRLDRLFGPQAVPAGGGPSVPIPSRPMESRANEPPGRTTPTTVADLKPAAVLPSKGKAGVTGWTVQPDRTVTVHSADRSVTIALDQRGNAARLVGQLRITQDEARETLAAIRGEVARAAPPPGQRLLISFVQQKGDPAAWALSRLHDKWGDFLWNGDAFIEPATEVNRWNARVPGDRMPETLRLSDIGYVFVEDPTRPFTDLPSLTAHTVTEYSPRNHKGQRALLPTSPRAVVRVNPNGVVVEILGVARNRAGEPVMDEAALVALMRAAGWKAELAAPQPSAAP
ncbi:hypothetical protein SAMN04488107_1620 [Geodermatophilus saharensis]|uniref:Uncharacterized protein n=1 Tax=Geodermatophilus saharensis TaxID=1137994 RepID=A0A239C629_9ACTN|nr:hypothetical protein [Geodermatophilus saharensis]SNS15081.1 hypothetical protein SAMN04488107_1620 [Geodermatophilus saharensis]